MRLADAMLRTNPERIRLLSHEELATYGLTPVDPIAAESFDLLAAKSYGLDRQEYRSESTCREPMRRSGVSR